MQCLNLAWWYKFCLPNKLYMIPEFALLLLSSGWCELWFRFCGSLMMVCFLLSSGSNCSLLLCLFLSSLSTYEWEL